MGTKHRFHAILFAVILTFFVTAMTIPAFAQTYSPLESSWSSTHNILDSQDSSHQFSFDKTYPGGSFKVFVPPGATRVSLILYTSQGKKIGVAARGDSSPQCSYNTSLGEDAFQCLPWDAPDGATLGGLRSSDYQTQNIDGQTVIIDGPVSQVSAPGEWIYVRALSYDNSSYGRVLYAVTVNVDAFNSWYSQTTFTSGQPPATSGITGGSCESTWYDGPADGECGGGSNPPPSSGTCTNSFEQFGCELAGGTWSGYPDCSCSDGSTTPPEGETDTEAPQVEVTAPTAGETVSGSYTFKATASDNEGVTKVSFYIDGTLFGEDSSSPYSATYDTSNLTTGSHTVMAKARDAANNQGSSEVQFTVEAAEPEVYPQTFKATPYGAKGFPVYMVNVDGSKVKIDPVIEFEPSLEGTYHLLAAYTKENELWLAEQDLTGDVDYWPLRTELKYYMTKTFTAKTSLTDCPAFTAFPELDVNLLKEKGTIFCFIAVPAAGNPNPMQGLIFGFSN